MISLSVCFLENAYRIEFKGEVSWSETGIIGVDNQIELKKLCGFKKKSKSKDCVERILEHFSFL